MDLSRVGLLTVVALAALAVSGCIAGEVPDSVGSLGISVDDQERPVVVVHPCEPTALSVDIALGREGLAPEEENEQVGTWTTSEPVLGTTELLLHDPSAPWEGLPAELLGARTYLVGGTGGGMTSLGMVAFRYGDLAEMEPGSVYVNDAGEPDAMELVPLTVEEFAAQACGG